VAVRLREARRGDELAVAEVHIRSWQEAYRDLMPAEFLAALDPGERAARYTFEGGAEAPTTVVAVEAGDGEAGDDFGGEGPGDDPSLTNSVEVRPGSSPGHFERLLGFVTFGASRDADAEGLGEVYALYVDPGRLRGGLGRLLMGEARAALRARGFDEAILWVLDGNERAGRFYEGEGWAPDGARREENVYDIASNVSRFRRGL
jgi:ribosomal protein S18 acetylase RimI-like enzyme